MTPFHLKVPWAPRPRGQAPPSLVILLEGINCKVDILIKYDFDPCIMHLLIYVSRQIGQLSSNKTFTYSASVIKLMSKSNPLPHPIPIL